MLLHEVEAPGPIDRGVDLLPCLQCSVSGMQQGPIWLALNIQHVHLKAGMNAADYKRCSHVRSLGRTSVMPGLSSSDPRRVSAAGR